MTQQDTSTGAPSVWRAHLAIFLATAGWGVMSPITKAVLLSGEITSFALTGIRIGGGALLFLIFSFLLPKGMRTREHIDRSDWWRIIICSLLIISINQGMFIIGIGYTNPVDASVMCALTPLLTMLLTAVFLRFPMTWMKVCGVLTGLAGVVALVLSTPQSGLAPNPMLGNALCFGAQLCAAVYFVAFSRIINKYSPYTLMKWLFFISVFTYVPFTLPEILTIDWRSLGVVEWSGIAYIVVMATFIGYLCIPFAQKTLKPTAVSAYGYLQPVFGAVTALMLGLGDFGWEKLCATLLIFLGVWMVNRSTTG